MMSHLLKTLNTKQVKSPVFFIHIFGFNIIEFSYNRVNLASNRVEIFCNRVNLTSNRVNCKCNRIENMAHLRFLNRFYLTNSIH